MHKESIRIRLEKLRAWMEKNNIHAYIIPSSDPHKSEYLPEHWQVRQWISGFTGSAGTAVVTLHHAGVWTDTRYFIQAEQELEDTGFVLHKLINQGEMEYLDWLSEELFKGDCVGIDGMLWSFNEVKQIDSMCTANGLVLDLQKDPFEQIWEDRVPRPMGKIFEVSPHYSGESRAERIAGLRIMLEQKGADAMLITALDEIAWLLHLRGKDVSCNPVFVAFAIVQMDQLLLFTDQGKIDSDLEMKLSQDTVKVLPYALIQTYLEQINPDFSIWIDPNKTAYNLYDALGTGKVMQGDSPIMWSKAIKTVDEQSHLRNVMVKDGVALVKAFRWLENEVYNGSVTEAVLAEKLAYYRSQQVGYFGESFDAIVGYKANGAIVHYRPEHGRCATIAPEGILLVDSGGQYEDGTTDITRTITLSEPEADQKKHYTLVLKGHIALASAVFPEGTRGVQLDVLARQFLWSEGLNYGHGTGHGVGFFMNVHEPPQGFVSNLGERGITAHKPGMYSSNEPGFYMPGKYGIRIENLVICQEHSNSAYGRFLHFETITLFPIDTRLVDGSLLSIEERAWLNDYHQRVYAALSPELDEEEQLWLADKCRAIQ